MLYDLFFPPAIPEAKPTRVHRMDEGYVRPSGTRAKPLTAEQLAARRERRTKWMQEWRAKNRRAKKGRKA